MHYKLKPECNAFERSEVIEMKRIKRFNTAKKLARYNEAMFSLRMPQDLRDALAVAAREDERTSASLLKAILRKWLVNHGHLKAK
jgi:hypothetical protein